MARKVLIIGHSGFSGYYLIKHLSTFQDIELIGIDIKKNNLIKEHSIDITDYIKVKTALKEIKPNYIINLVGTSFSTISKDYYLLNVIPALNILNALSELKFDATKVLLVSSAAVYGNQQLMPLKEDIPLYPINLYGLSKLSMEHAALYFSKNSNIDLKIVRPFNLLGKGLNTSLSVASFVEQIHYIKKNKATKMLQTGNLASKRDFIDIKDAVKAYWIFLQKGEAGGIYNVGSGVSTEMKKVVEMIIENSGLKITIQEQQSRIKTNDINESRADITKLKNLGWKPEVPLIESLKEMANLYSC